MQLQKIKYKIRYNTVCLYFILANMTFDMVRFARFSSSFKKNRSPNNLRAWLSVYYHKIEKGLALPFPKVGFGKDWIIPDFLPLLEQYYNQNGVDSVVLSCKGALETYITLHNNKKIPSSDPTIVAINRSLEILKNYGLKSAGGVIPISSNEIINIWQMDFKRFALSRHSIRSFRDKSVDKSLIEDAVNIAKYAPSVCNRQPWHIYAIDDKKKIKEVLKYQTGNNGFGHTIPCLLLITGDLSSMLWHYERNQIWVDSGIFSMCLVFALQSLGLGTCMLNLCRPYTIERKLAAICNIPKSERTVLMIAVGHLPDELNVACSQRKHLSSVLTWV